MPDEILNKIGLEDKQTEEINPQLDVRNNTPIPTKEKVVS